MPLQDHFHPPLYPANHWESFHGGWPMVIATQLNERILPREFKAAPLAKLGTEVEVDVATFERPSGGQPAGVVTATYAPPQPGLTCPLDFTDLDVFEIQVKREDGNARLVAAIELVSPANKDRPANRQAFALKCASYLYHGVAVIVVDIVTLRLGNLHAELLNLLGHPPQGNGQAPGDLYACSYRTVRSKKKKIRLEVWSSALAIGTDLPTLPLWLAGDLVVPLDLELSYTTTCRGLKIP